MDRTVDISGLPTLVFQCLLASSLVFGALFVGGFVLFRVAEHAGVAVGRFAGAPTLAAAGVLWPVLTVLWVRHLRRAAGDWWGPIPREQYTRFAGYGGLARHNWEKAVRQLPDDDEDGPNR